MKRLLTISLAILLALGLSIVPLPAQPAMAQTTINVPTDYPTIQAGINAAFAGDTVQVAAGTYYENITLKSGVIVQGVGAGVTTINGGGSGSVVAASHVDSAAKLDGFTITNGSASYYGGGIYLYYSSPTISNSTISGNSSSYYGGGISARRSSPTISNCTISGNSARYDGGGIYLHYSSPTISNSIISGNSPRYYGGGIYAEHSSPSISNSIISGNSVSYEGGGIYLYYSSPTISNNIISNNSAEEGGGICADHSSPTIINNVITGNSANLVGGGIAARYGSSPTISNNIIIGNSAEQGGGIFAYYSSPSINYNNVWGNLANNYYGWPSYGLPAGPNDISLDPLFGDPTAGDYHLQSTSPCIDAGDNTAVPSWLTTDFEGDPRIVDGDGDGTATVDMGADEYYVALVPATIDIDPDTLNLKGKGRWITAYIELPQGYDVADIAATTVLLNGTVSAVTDPKYDFVTDPSEYITDNDGDGILERMVKFDRSAVQGILGVGDAVEITVTGEVAGMSFEGSDIIRVK